MDFGAWWIERGEALAHAKELGTVL
jgi:hypothetical protein